MLIQKIHPLAKTPTKGSDGAAGYDLYSVERIVINPGERKLISIGLKMQIPKTYYGRIAPRSGLALKHGIDVMAGVIDSDYRNIVGVILYNSAIIGSRLFDPDNNGLLFADNNAFNINPGDRIAQIIFERHYDFEFEEGELSETKRGEGGFGHSGT